MHLVDVDVLGVAAAACDNEVGFLRDDAAVDLVHKLAGFLVRGDVVAREHSEELVLGVENRVKEKERAALGEKRHAFHLVFVAGVAGGKPEACVLVEHKAVIDAYRFHRGAPGENGLSAAAVTGEVVVHDGAGEDHVIDVADVFVKPHRGAARGGAEVLEVFLLGAGAVVHLEARGNVLAHGFDHFFVRHVAVGAERKDDVHVFVFDTQLIQFVDQNRHEVKAVGNAGGVVADKGDGIPGLDDFVDGLTADRVVDRVKDALLDVGHRREFFGAHFFENVRVINGKLLAAVAVGEVKGLDGHENSLSIGLRARLVSDGLLCVFCPARYAKSRIPAAAEIIGRRAGGAQKKRLLPDAGQRR